MKALEETMHRPWPLPASGWAMTMTWEDLLFAHWPLPQAALRSLVPPALALDIFDGSAWIGVVPFRMTGVRLRGLPAVPGTSAFPELNVRTYVTAEGKPGVWFFSLDAASRIAVRAARAWFHLPYFDARMDSRRENGEVVYTSRRTPAAAGGAPPAEFGARYHPMGEIFRSAPGTLEHFLTERYCLYAASSTRAGNSRLWRGEIHHPAWPLQRAAAEISFNTMTEPLGLRLPDTPPLLHFARRLDVVAWPPQRLHG